MAGHPFHIDFLDHVAIRVSDLEASARWYEQVLGMKRYQPPEWKPFPIFMLSGNFGVALFPAREEDPLPNPNSRNVCIDHFAFRVSMEEFRKAHDYFRSISVDFHFQDHHYFHSVYMKDPDGHTVELTTAVTPPGN